MDNNNRLKMNLIKNINVNHSTSPVAAKSSFKKDIVVKTDRYDYFIDKSNNSVTKTDNSRYDNKSNNDT